MINNSVLRIRRLDKTILTVLSTVNKSCPAAGFDFRQKIVSRELVAVA